MRCVYASTALYLCNCVLVASTSPPTPRQVLVDCLPRSARVTKLAFIDAQFIDGGPGGGQDSMIYFQLNNPTLDVQAQCSAHGPSLGPKDMGNRLYDPAKWYNCFMESRDPTIGAVFQFDSSVNRLTVNETWSCQNETTGTP